MPVLTTDTACAPLVVLIVWLPNVRLDGLVARVAVGVPPPLAA